MAHIFLLDQLRYSLEGLEDNANRLMDYINTHQIDCQPFIHSMVVASNSLDALRNIAEQFFGTIIANFRLYIIAPLQGLFPMPADYNKLPNLEALGRYNFTHANSYGQGVVVANIDDGVYSQHQEFNDRYLGHWFGINRQTGNAEFNTGQSEWVSEHGTHTMGTMCGSNVGTASRAKFTFLKLFNDSGADLMDMFKLVDLVIQKFKEDPVRYPLPHVFNCSFGTEIPDGTPESDPSLTQYSVALRHMYDAVKPYGSLFLFAAGNDALSGNQVELPSFFDHSISVGSVAVNNLNNSFQRSRFSSYGRCLDVTDSVSQITDNCPLFVAPGEDVLSCVPPLFSFSGYAKLSGTSMATPAACGVIACMYSYLISTGISRLEATQRIFTYIIKPESFIASTVNNGNSSNGTGFGLLNMGSFSAVLVPL